MEMKNGGLEIERKLSRLDELVLDFTGKLKELDVKYVIVSGYVAILAGRSRGTEDIDIIVERMPEDRLERVARGLEEAGYWCINSEVEKVYEMLEDDLVVRFAEEGKAIPNFEMKFPGDEFKKTALEESIPAKLNSDEIRISPIELQIAYKLYLGAEKDFEDALHLYQLFMESIDEKELENYARKLKVGDKLDELGEA